MASLNTYGALSFDGTTQHGSTPTDFANLTNKNFAIDFAFRMPTGTGTLLSRRAAGIGFTFVVTIVSGSRRLRFQLNGLQTLFDEVIDTDWHKVHVTVSRDTNEAHLFYDGVLEQTLGLASLSSNTVDPAVSSAKLHVAWDGTSSVAKADISEIRISNRTRHFKAYVAPVRQFVDDHWTVGLYHFNEGIPNDYAYDMSESRNHLTILNRPDYIEGPHKACPITAVRESVWLAMDEDDDLTDYLESRNGKKYKYRPGDESPRSYTVANTPALSVFPTALPDIDPETSAFHNVKVPIQIRGYLHHEDVSEIEYFWWITLAAVYHMYQNSTAGRFNYGRIQHMKSSGPSFDIMEEEGGLFSNFVDTLEFDVHHDFLKS